MAAAANNPSVKTFGFATSLCTREACHLIHRKRSPFPSRGRLDYPSVKTKGFDSSPDKGKAFSALSLRRGWLRGAKPGVVAQK